MEFTWDIFENFHLLWHTEWVTGLVLEMLTHLKTSQPKSQDDPKNYDNTKNEDNDKSEDDPKTEDINTSEDDIQN